MEDMLRVHPAVKSALDREFASYASSARRGAPLWEAGTYSFVIAAKMATLRRFPAGPMDWEISGITRSWLMKMPWRDRLPALRIILIEMGGFAPVFFMHTASPPRNRALVLAKEVEKGYYLMARSLAFQPKIRGIVAESWFHDPAAVKDRPHLEALNGPYRHGGFITTVGPATVNVPKAVKAAGRIYQRGLAIWPRAKAIAWAEQRPQLEQLVS
jgi:hypothetical protein